MVHHSLIKSSLFLLGGAAKRVGGSDNLKKLGGILHTSHVLALFFMISAMALAGVPPLSGFFSKFGLVVSGLKGGHIMLVGAALITSLFTLYSMLKIWRLGFWGKPATSHAYHPKEFGWGAKGILVGSSLSVLFVLVLSLWIQPILNIAKTASTQLLNPDQYIEAVLGHKPIPQKGRPAL